MFSLGYRWDSIFRLSKYYALNEKHTTNALGMVDKIIALKEKIPTKEHPNKTKKTPYNFVNESLELKESIRLKSRIKSLRWL